MDNVVNDYLWTKQLSVIDHTELIKAAGMLELVLVDQFGPMPSKPPWPYGSFTSSLYKKYNFFSFVNTASLKLFEMLKLHVTPILDPNMQYVMQSWLNIFEKDNFIDWHGHWKPEMKVFHGYYCVNVGDTITSYRREDTKEFVYDVQNTDGLLVLGRSGEDEHKSSPWNDKYPRITIAFDFIPITTIKDYSINHFIPFKC